MEWCTGPDRARNVRGLAVSATQRRWHWPQVREGIDFDPFAPRRTQSSDRHNGRGAAGRRSRPRSCDSSLQRAPRPNKASSGWIAVSGKCSTTEWAMVPVSDMLALVLPQRSRTAPLLVGIDCRSRSGKSALAALIARWSKESSSFTPTKLPGITHFSDGPTFWSRACPVRFVGMACRCPTPGSRGSSAAARIHRHPCGNWDHPRRRASVLREESSV